MPDPLPRPVQRSAPPRSRRQFLLAAAALLTGQASRAAVPAGALLVIGGPAQGATAAWADTILPALTHALPPGIRLGRECVGGPDGVTAANQFEAHIAFDGEAALLLPGAAALAWLVGDPRARFNAAQWVTTLASTTPIVLASRIPLNRIVPGQVVRVAGSPGGPTLPALLTLDLMGALPQTVADWPGNMAVDAVLLHGRNIERQLQEASRVGFVPILAFHERDADGQFGRDPDFPELPTVGERLPQGSQQPLLLALGAAIAAARLDTALVLPPLTSPSMVALWRRACANVAIAPATQAAAARLGLHAEADAAAVASTAPLAAIDAAVLLDLRQWLAQRLGWHPS